MTVTRTCVVCGKTRTGSPRKWAKKDGKWVCNICRKPKPRKKVNNG